MPDAIEWAANPTNLAFIGLSSAGQRKGLSRTAANIDVFINDSEFGIMPIISPTGLSGPFCG